MRMVRHLPRLLALLLLLVAGIGLEPAARANVSTPLVVIVANGLPLRSISLALLRRAFQGEATEYAPGKRLIPINQAHDSSLRASFDYAVLGLEPAEMGRFWVDRRIRDQPGPPKAVATPELGVRVVASLPGAITYTSPELVSARVQPVSVDGKRSATKAICSSDPSGRVQRRTKRTRGP